MACMSSKRSAKVVGSCWLTAKIPISQRARRVTGEHAVKLRTRDQRAAHQLSLRKARIMREVAAIACVAAVASVAVVVITSLWLLYERLQVSQCVQTNDQND